MGKLDIDYQVLHDAFFKYQTKPNLSGLGELYYEGKEFEARVSRIMSFSVKIAPKRPRIGVCGLCSIAASTLALCSSSHCAGSSGGPWAHLHSCLQKVPSPRLACASQVKSAKAGLVTPQLREALGMEEGAPPPWLINMQRYGPPPSYPDLPVSARL